MRLRVNWRRLARTLAAQVVALVAATVIVSVLERGFGVPHAASVYLLAVAAVAVLAGSTAAAGTAIGAFLAYNYLFVPPFYTFAVAEANGILNLLLLLIVGVLIGRLAGLHRDRTREAQHREREALALFAVTQSLARVRRTQDALSVIAERLARDTRMNRVWIGLGPTEAQELVAADSSGGDRPTTALQFVLRRTSDVRRGDWVRIRPTGPPAERRAVEHLYRVAISAGADAIGSIWALRPATIDAPSAEESRLLAATADAIAQSVVRDRLATQATELEIAQRSDELKSALLDSVSHDIRTPLSAIRAAAGSLADPDIEWTDAERAATAAQIDAEAQRLNRIVGNLLDMGRIQAGALRPDLVMLPVEDAVRDAVAHSLAAIGDHPLEIDVRSDVPPVIADAVMLEEALVNLFENVGRHVPAGTAMRVTAQAGNSQVKLSVEDAGNGLPEPALDRVFERFYQVPSANPGSRRGTGLGLAVVRGMVEAMGGTVSARPSALGGLAIDLELPSASAAQLSEHAEAASD